MPTEIKLKKKTFVYPVHFLLATFLFGVTACGTQSGVDDEDVPDICSDPAFADFDENLYEIDFEPWPTEGNTTNYDSDLNFVVLGYEKEGPDKESHGRDYTNF